jgi:hypothetical protein
MKKTLFSILFVVIMIFGFLFLAKQEKENPLDSGKKSSNIESIAMQNVEELEKVDPETAKFIDTLTEEDLEKLKYNFDAANAANQNVVFYGKCVDQNGNPIAGVSVKAKLTKMRKSMTSVLANGSFKYYVYLEAISDQNGRFEFFDEGSYLLLQSIDKSGYMDARGPDRGYQFGQILHGNKMAGMHDPDPLKPVVFTMWKKGDGSQTILTKRKVRGEFGADVQIEKDAMDRAHFFDLKQGKIAGSPSTNTLTIVGENEGDAHWDPVKLKNVVSKRYFSWSFQLEIAAGGLQETEDQFLFLPPDSGYQESYEFSVSDDPEQWTGGILGKKFYFRTVEGNYGAFVLNARSSAEGVLSFYFEKIFFNPTGERDLEFLEVQNKGDL